MTEQARPIKGRLNRLDTLNTTATDVPGVATYPDEVDQVEEVQTAETVRPKRRVLDVTIATGWLNWETLIWLAIIVLAVATRMWDLSSRALHHDESIHGVFSYDMYTGHNIYRYDPTWHGPVLYYMVTLSFFLLGGANEFSLRFAPAMYGIGLIAICYFLRPLIGKLGAIIFAILMLVSPTVLYYSRSLRHDIFATFGMLLFVIGFFRFAQARAGKSSGTGWMATAGLGFFLLFGSHEMSFINLAMLLTWLGIVFLFELVALPAWVRRYPSKKVVVADEVAEIATLPLDEELEADAELRPVTTSVPRLRLVRDDDDLDELVEEYDVEEQEELSETLSQSQNQTYSTKVDGFEEVTEDGSYVTTEHVVRPIPMYGRGGEERVDPILGSFRIMWPTLFAIFGLMSLLGSIHLFSEQTYEKRLIQFVGVNAYFIFIPFYLLLSAGASYLVAKLVNYGYNRLSAKSNQIARLAALVAFVILVLAAGFLFIRGLSPTAYLAAAGEKISGTAGQEQTAVIDKGFQSFNVITYGGLQWFSILPELVIILVAALLFGMLVGWLWERRFLVYTERGLYGFGITAFFITLVASLISLRFILVEPGATRPIGYLPLIGTIDKWAAYVIGGAVVGLVVGFVAGWFVSLAELIPDSALRGSTILRSILRFVRQPWSVVALLAAFGIPYILIFSNFFFTPERLADGFYRGIEYWIEQHDSRRLDEPWFYYPMLMMLYETFALVMFFIALFYFPIVWWKRSAQRGRLIFTAKGVFIGLTFWWSFISMVAYSIAGEKIPWLNMQIALPVSLAAAAFLNDYIRQLEWRRIFRWREGGMFGLLFILMFAASLVLIGMAINFPTLGKLDTGLNQTITGNDITTKVVQMVLVGLVGLALFGFSLWLWLTDRLKGQTARAIIMLVMGTILFAYCLKSTIVLNYAHPDVAVEPMIYTQTTPEIPLLIDRLGRLSRDLRDTYKVAPLEPQPGQLPDQYPDPANSKGIPLFISSGNASGGGGVDWPLHWYLRDYTDVTYDKVGSDANGGTPLAKLTDSRGNNYVMIMVAKDDDSSALQQELAGQYTAETYKFRWYFPEDDTGYGGLGWTPPDDYRSDTLAKKDISNTRWDIIWQSLTQQPYVGRLWRYIVYRQLWQPLESYDMVVYVRNDVYADFAMTNNTGDTTGGSTTGTTGGNTGTAAYDLTASTQSGNHDGQYNTPRNVAIAPSGDIYVLDSLNGRIQHFDATGKFISKFGSIGSGDGQFSLQQYQSGPGGITIDDEGNVYVADTWGYRIEKFDKDGKFLLKWGQGQDVSTDPTLAQQYPTSFYGPRAIAFDKATGELFITDTGNKRVVVYDKNGQFKRQFGSKGSGQGQFDEPTAIALSPDDSKVYVTDLHNLRVEILDTNGTYISEIPVPTWKTAILAEPYLAFGPNGDLFVSDPANATILRFDSTGKQVNSYGAGTGLPLLNPIGLAFDTDGNLYIADAKKNAIIKTKP